MRLIAGALTRSEQQDLVAAIAAVVADAPLYQPVMPKTGKPMSVWMSNCGPLGWVTDKERGYRYQPTHPVTGRSWPPMPDILADLWRRYAECSGAAEACLINHYRPGARMGLHQDRDEADFSAPVLSVSLGDTALFRLGGQTRKDPTRSFRLASGDILLLVDKTRLAFHGIDRVYPDTSTLLARFVEAFPQGGRINLTLRRVSALE